MQIALSAITLLVSINFSGVLAFVVVTLLVAEMGTGPTEHKLIWVSIFGHELLIWVLGAITKIYLPVPGGGRHVSL